MNRLATAEAHRGRGKSDDRHVFVLLAACANARLGTETPLSAKSGAATCTNLVRKAPLWQRLCARSMAEEGAKKRRGWNDTWNDWTSLHPKALSRVLNHGILGPRLLMEGLVATECVMATTDDAAVYDELLDLLAEGANADRVLAFRLSDAKQDRLDTLLDKNREGTLTAAETTELDAYERFEHVVRLLKIRVLQKLRA